MTLLARFISDEHSTFGSHTTSAGLGGAGAGYVALADVNGDGKADLIKLESDADIHTYMSKGDGTFEDPVETTGPGNQIYFADLNGDGRIDLIKRDRSTTYQFFSSFRMRV